MKNQAETIECVVVSESGHAEVSRRRTPEPTRAANDNFRCLFEHACAVAAACDCCWFAWIGLVDIAGDRIVPVAAAGYEDHYLEDLRVDISDTPYGRGAIGSAVRQECTWVISDIENDARVAPWRDAALRRGYRSAAAFPVRSGKHVVAVLAVYSATIEAFDRAELERFTRLTEELGRLLLLAS